MNRQSTIRQSEKWQWPAKIVGNEAAALECAVEEVSTACMPAEEYAVFEDCFGDNSVVERIPVPFDLVERTSPHYAVENGEFQIESSELAEFEESLTTFGGGRIVLVEALQLDVAALGQWNGLRTVM